MPIYDYFCQACGQQSEIMHRISDAPATVCPVCGKPALTKQLSPSGFRLKGGGWYETDFKSGGKKNLAGEAKPEAKPDAKGADAAKSGGDAASSGAGTSPASAPSDKAA